MKKLITGCMMIAVLFTACNNTKLVSSWKAPNVTSTKYDKVLVMAMTGSKDRELRETMENAVAKRLNDNGIIAVSALQQYGPKSFRTMSEEQAVRQVNDNGFDAVLVVALLDKKQESKYTPGYITSTPYAVVRNRWYGNYSVLYDRMYTPGYYTNTTDYSLEANFYNTKGDKLLYSAETKSFDPNSAGELASEFSKTVISDMKGKGVISN